MFQSQSVTLLQHSPCVNLQFIRGYGSEEFLRPIGNKKYQFNLKAVKLVQSARVHLFGFKLTCDAFQLSKTLSAAKDMSRKVCFLISICTE